MGALKPAGAVALAFAAALGTGDPSIETIAGSGGSGIADGPALSATFLAPEGIAARSDGSIAIADTAAQRIRLLRAGRVVTLAGAGSVESNWDAVAAEPDLGSAAAPHFDAPVGLAELPDGTLLIADSGHHCIRSYRDGRTQTFAGSPARGTSDGTRDDATFDTPNALAVDGAGHVFVADLHGGLREIAGDRVTTIPLPKALGISAFGVAVTGLGARERIFVSTDRGLAVIDAAGNATSFGADAEGDRPFGYPAALAPVRADAVAFADPRDNTVRLFRLPVHDGDPPLVEPLAIDVPEDGQFAGGDDAGPPLRGARFASPFGIARERDGSLLVADTGNRRIRRIDAAATRLPFEDPAAVLPVQRTWIVGGPPAFWNTLWPDSIAGRLGTRSHHAVDAFEYDDEDPGSAGRALDALARARATRIVWIVTTRDLTALGPDLLAAAARRAVLGARALIVLVPLGGELDASRDFAQAALDPHYDRAAATARFAAAQRALRAAHVPLLDLSGAILGDALHEDPYETATPQLSDGGRATVARSIGEALARL